MDCVVEKLNIEDLNRQWDELNKEFMLEFSVKELMDLDFVEKKIREIYDEKIVKEILEDYKFCFQMKGEEVCNCIDFLEVGSDSHINLSLHYGIEVDYKMWHRYVQYKGIEFSMVQSCRKLIIWCEGKYLNDIEFKEGFVSLDEMVDVFKGKLESHYELYLERESR